MKNRIFLFLGVIFLSFSGYALADDDDRRKGLNRKAKQELIAAGVNKYVGDFTPGATADVGDGWTKHTFDTAGGAGPICVAGTAFSAFTKVNNPKKLLIFMQGGGACWQDFYACNILAEDQEPPPVQVGIWGSSGPGGAENPLADYSVLYMPYCDGSVFTGDNDVVDASFPFGPVRFHRGLRNATAGIDFARSMFPKAKRIVVSGSSAGGVGAAAFAPFLVRMAYRNKGRLSVINDAGPVAINLDDNAAIIARAADWDFGKFYPASCVECSDMGQSTAIIKWRLDNDRSIREGIYETDLDLTNRFFMNLLFDPVAFRDIVVTEHGILNAAHPDRYKRFIVSGDTSHTALQSPLFYSNTANGTPLNEWVADMLKPGDCEDDDDDDDDSDDDSDDDDDESCVWVDIVEDPVL